MITFLEFFLTCLSLGILVISFFLRIEHRLTKIETKLDLHLENQAKRQNP